MIALAAVAGAALMVVLALVRLVLGPTHYDRAAAAKAVAVRGALVAGAMAVAAGQSAWIDAALAMLLGVLVLMAAAAKVFRARTFQAPMAREDT